MMNNILLIGLKILSAIQPVQSGRFAKIHKSLNDSARWIGSSQEKRRKKNKRLLKYYRRKL